MKLMKCVNCFQSMYWFHFPSQNTTAGETGREQIFNDVIPNRIPPSRS